MLIHDGLFPLSQNSITEFAGFGFGFRIARLANVLTTRSLGIIFFGILTLMGTFFKPPIPLEIKSSSAAATLEILRLID
jgi:hypothetical protein